MGRTGADGAADVARGVLSENKISNCKTASVMWRLRLMPCRDVTPQCSVYVPV